MTVEAPAAPQSRDSLPPREVLTDELLAELERAGLNGTGYEYEAMYGLEASPSYDPTEATDPEAEAEKTKFSYFEPDEPERIDDERNRAIDHEILGKAVSLRYDINAKAIEAVSGVERMFAHAKNLASKPRAAVRKWHMDRAEKSLVKKEARLEKKQQTWQSKIDSAGSERLATHRQEKATKVIHKERAKVADYKANHVERRQKNYHETIAARSGRLERVDRNKDKMNLDVIKSRQKFIDRKAVAVGRKELRDKLRGTENKASRRETRQIINEILGEENASQALRRLGRDVIGRQLAERNVASSDLDHMDAQQTVDRLSAEITREEQRREEMRIVINRGSRDFFTISNLETEIKKSEQNTQILQNQLADARRQLTNELWRSSSVRIEEAEERENVDKRVHDILR